MTFILALDQSTTSSRAILHDGDRRVVCQASAETRSCFPRPGWVEQDPDDILRTSFEVLRRVLVKSGATLASIAAMGITNQRETVVVWDRATGQPIAPAIVWQDRRTSGMCRRLAAEGHTAMIAERTGLLPDPYFSGTKIAWILDQVEGARERSGRGELLAGTIDSFVLWHLTGGEVHATDATNASRTMLYNIREGCWDDDLCRLLGVPRSMLADVRDCADDYGTSVIGNIPIRGVAGDQQAAAIGQACFRPGMMKVTCGTGCFALLNIGSEPVISQRRLLTTVAWQLAGERCYALEGSIFNAGTVVQWLRDGLDVIRDAGDTPALAEAADPLHTPYLVPAFTGLGAPWWDAECRGAIHGLTRASGKAELVRAALESLAYQVRDLLGAMLDDQTSAGDRPIVRVDGGMSANDFAMQFLADILDMPVDRMANVEATALGVAWLSGHHAGVWPDMDSFAGSWQGDRRFTPAMERAEADRRYQGWQDAVRRTLVRNEGAMT
ncbi:MAG: glycerol kinase GlpK [bacterium]|nr:glycerol kinase GlpK [bacterium]